MNVYVLTYWSDREYGYTHVFYTLKQAQDCAGKRKKWKRVVNQWFSETNKGVYRIRRKRVRGRKP